MNAAHGRPAQAAAKVAGTRRLLLLLGLLAALAGLLGRGQMLGAIDGLAGRRAANTTLSAPGSFDSPPAAHCGAGR